MKASIIDNDGNVMGEFTFHEKIAKAVSDGLLVTLEFGGWDGENFPHGIAKLKHD